MTKASRSRQSAKVTTASGPERSWSVLSISERNAQSEKYDNVDLSNTQEYHWNQQHYNFLTLILSQLDIPFNPFGFKSAGGQSHNRVSPIRNLETILSYQMALFLCLSPASFLKEIVNNGMGGELPGSVGQRKEVYRFRNIDTPTASVPLKPLPILLIESESLVMAIILKIGTKTNIDELVNCFAFLKQCSEGRQRPVHRRSPHRDFKKYLCALYIGPRGFADIWNEQYISQGLCQTYIKEKTISVLTSKFPNYFGNGIMDMKVIERNLYIGYLSYTDFYDLIETASKKEEFESSETYVKLFDGMKRELKFRGLS